MKKTVLLFLFLTLTITVLGQHNMRPVEELINQTEPGWDLVQQWIDSAENNVEVLPRDPAQAKDALFKTQVTTRSPMGAIVYSTGGILIDGGWIRILGSGHTRLNRTLPDWNKGKSFNEFGESMTYLLIADDAIGGLFAINAGKFDENNLGIVYYLAPETPQWESLDWNYSEFLNVCFNGDLNVFYKGFRWENWEKDVSILDGNSAYNFFPYLWTKEGKDPEKASRSVVPIQEHYLLLQDFRKQLGLE